MYTFAYLGMQQIVIILVIALLIFGPQKVPELGRQIGGALRDLKKMSNEVQSAFDLDDHQSYDRYEPPTYEYTPPVSTAYGHESLDQYGLPIAPEHPAIEGSEPGTPELSPTIAEATQGEEGVEPEPTAVTETAPEVVAPLTTENTTVISADAEAKGA
jgi:TatA/E family protein of Tat protein translocase